MTGFDESNIVKETIEQADRLVRQAYSACIEDGQLSPGIELQGSIRLTRALGLGDLACSYAIRAAKQLGEQPDSAAQAICSRFSLDGSYFSSAEAAANGFINLTLSNKWYAAVLARIEGAGSGFGYTGEGRGKSIVLNFIPEGTGAMTINDVRGLVMRDVTAGVMERAGYEVYRKAGQCKAADFELIAVHSVSTTLTDPSAGEGRLKQLRYAPVQLLKDGRPVMKKYSASELLEGIQDRAERFFLSTHSNKPAVLDLDLIRRSDGANPLYCIRYAHARIRSIIKGLMAEGYEPPAASDTDISLLSTRTDKELIKLLALFPEEIRLASLELEPSRLCRYLSELAAGFFRFYKTERIRGTNAGLTEARLKLIESIKIIIENGLDILGIPIL